MSSSHSIFVSSGLGAACATLVACGLTASRTPLGGDYKTPENVSTEKRRPHAEASPIPSAEARTSPPPPDKHTLVKAAVGITAGGSAASNDANALRYEPLKAGDQIREDVSLAFSAQFQGSSTDLHGNDNQIVVDATLHADLKVVRASAQSLDQLEVTLTPISLHTEFDGHSSDTKQDPPETFEISLSGQTPSIRVQSGSPLQKEDRITLIVLLTPLVEFHNHWARSPTLVLKPGWSNNVPVRPPGFAPGPAETVHVGPLSVRYDGPDGSGGNTPFELGLPVEWSTDFGRLHFECAGRAVLGPKGRPVSLDLTSPITGSVGPAGSQSGLHGTAKLAATLSYS